MQERYKITLFDIKTKQQNISEISVILDDETDEFVIDLKTENLQIKSKHCDYFSAFKIFKDELLNKGYGIKCNGSKINAVQSAMMANSDKIYLVELGRVALTQDIANIWDYADISEFFSTKEQQLFFIKWKGSINL